jgi:hypothetical protein
MVNDTLHGERRVDDVGVTTVLPADGLDIRPSRGADGDASIASPPHAGAARPRTIVRILCK